MLGLMPRFDKQPVKLIEPKHGDKKKQNGKRVLIPGDSSNHNNEENRSCESSFQEVTHGKKLKSYGQSGTGTLLWDHGLRLPAFFQYPLFGWAR